MIIVIGFYHTWILVLFVLVTKPHFISPNVFPCLTCYFPRLTGQSLHSLSAFRSVCCSFVLFVMCCLLTLLWIRSENILDQGILQGCRRAADLLWLKKSWAAQNAVASNYPEFCEFETSCRTNYLYLHSLRTSRPIGSLTLSRFLPPLITEKALLWWPNKSKNDSSFLCLNLQGFLSSAWTSYQAPWQIFI